MKVKTIILMLVSCILLSCSSMMKSGRYVKLNQNYSSQKLAELFNVPAWKLEEFNKGKKFSAGESIFIPASGGIIASQYTGRSIANVNYSQLKSDGRFLWPVPSMRKVSSHFGHRWGRKHEGLDIPGRKGAHILAADSGVVVYSGKELGGYGNITVISHSDGFFTVYAHAHKNYTKTGQKVHRGQVIAAVGSTGRSTGNHLHFEIRRDSHAFNPKKFFAHLN